jgi:hypothetical protein
MAYSSVVFEESRTIGDIASSRSALALPAYARDNPIRAPIFKVCLELYSNFSNKIATTGSHSFLIPLLTIPIAM